MAKKIIGLTTAVLLLFSLATCNPPEEEKPMGTFYSLQEAYAEALLTKDHLLSIAYYYNGGRIGNEVLMTEEYSPIEKTPKELTSQMENSIKSAYLTKLQIPSSLIAEHPNGISILDYFGIYEDCVAVRITDTYIPKDLPLAMNCSIDGVLFIDFRVEDIKIWRKNK